jgi:hypothetical protein
MFLYWRLFRCCAQRRRSLRSGYALGGLEILDFFARHMFIDRVLCLENNINKMLDPQEVETNSKTQQEKGIGSETTLE